MPATLSLLGPWKAPTPVVRRHPKAVLATDAGHRLELPYAPTESELGGLAHSYAIVPRPGRKALVLPDSPGLRTLSFDLIVGRPDHQESVEDVLHVLRMIADGAHRVTIGNLGPDVALNAWRLTELTQRTTLRQHGSNATTRATVPLAFVEASDAVVKVGPLTGGAKSSPTTKAAPARPATPTAGRTYVVRAGDNLTSIAAKFYGDGGKWKALGDVNHVRDPRKLAVGTRLSIPAHL